MGDRKVIRRLNLPPELWSEIAKRLPPEEVVHLRFRSICSLCRSSTPPFQPPLPHLPNITKVKPCSLVERRVFLLQIPEDMWNLPITLGFRRSFLIKVSKGDDKLRLESLLSNTSIDYDKAILSQSGGKVLDLWNLRVIELCRAFTPQKGSGITALQINSAGTAMASDYLQLIYCRAGGKEWSKNDDMKGNWRDIIDYKGQFCAIDKQGRTLLFDSSFAPTQISSRIVYNPTRYFSTKRLVESCGELFLVEIYESQPKVYRLNMEEKAWIEVKSLGNRMFFVAEGCSFSVSAQDFPGCKGNCVYFQSYGDTEKEFDERLRFCGPKTHVYDLETGRFGEILSFPEHLTIFWPPPSWLEQPGLLTLALLRKHI